MSFVVLGVFWCHFWLTFGTEDCSRSGFGCVEKMMQKKVKNNFKKGGVVPYNNLWSVAVPGHGAPWSLGKGVRLGTGHALHSRRDGGLTTD